MESKCPYGGFAFDKKMYGNSNKCQDCHKHEYKFNPCHDCPKPDCCDKVNNGKCGNRSKKSDNVPISIENFYILDFSANVKFCNPASIFVAELVSTRNGSIIILASGQASSGNTVNLHYENILAQNTVLYVRVITGQKICDVEYVTNVIPDTFRYEQIRQLAKVTDFDNALQIQYIINQPLDLFPPAPAFKPQFPPPPAPQQYPWNAIVIPWREGQDPLPPTAQFPNANWYDKFQSIQYSLFFYIGIDMFTIPPDSPEITIFIKNFVDRGSDNYLKKAYMAALTNEIVVNNYAAKIDNMLNEAYTKFTVNHEPVLSAFKDVLIRFFLAIHVGIDDYPAEIIEYFRTFIDIVGFGDPNRPGRDAAMIRGNTLAPTVKEYFRQRSIIVVRDKDASTLIYHWDAAGLPIESLMIEGVHNIIAFSQFNNTLYRLIADKLWADPAHPYNFPPPQPAPPGLPPPRGDIPYWYPYPPIPINIPQLGVGPVDFFAKLTAAPPGPDRLNVVREAFRILAPNTNAFSKLQTGNPSDPPTQARHIWQQIMIFNMPGATQQQKTLAYFKYNPALYDANFRTDLTDYTPIPPLQPLENNNPERLFVISPTDNNPVYDDGTVLDKSNPKLFPVPPVPIYLPFGTSYRRCAGETLNYFLVEKLLERFSDLEFEVRPLPSPPDFTKYQTLAPFTAVPNNIFVKGI